MKYRTCEYEVNMMDQQQLKRIEGYSGISSLSCTLENCKMPEDRITGKCKCARRISIGRWMCEKVNPGNAPEKSNAAIDVEYDIVESVALNIHLVLLQYFESEYSKTLDQSDLKLAKSEVRNFIRSCIKKGYVY